MRFFSFISSCYLVQGVLNCRLGCFIGFLTGVCLRTACLSEDQAGSSLVGSMLKVRSGKERQAGEKYIQKTSFPSLHQTEGRNFCISVLLRFQDQAFKMPVSGSIYEPFPTFRRCFFPVRAKSLPSSPVSVVLPCLSGELVLCKVSK